MPDRMYSPSPTVRSSRVPFYLRGSGPGIFSPSDPHTAQLIASGIDPDTADLIFGAVVNGVISEKQFEEILSGEMSDEDLGDLLYGKFNIRGENQIPAAGVSDGSGRQPSSGNAGQAAFSLLELGLSGIGQIDYSDPNLFEVSAGLPPDATNYVMASSVSPISPSDYVVSPDGTFVQDTSSGSLINTQTGNVYDSTGALIWNGSGPVLANVPLPAPGQSVTGSTAAAIGAAMATALKAGTALATGATGPSPKIAVGIPSTASPVARALSQSTMIPGIPDVAVIGIGLLAMVGLMSKR